MNRPIQQLPPNAAVQQQQLQAIQSRRVLNGLRTGVELLEDKNVVAPIAMHGGLTDLKWLLQGLLGGQFSLDLDPQENQPGGSPTDSAKHIASMNLEVGEGEGSGGNGSE